MDEALAQRLRITEETGMAPPETVAFVAEVLHTLATDHEITDASAGMMASHLIAALVRAASGETIDGPPSAAFDESVSAAPDAYPRAHQVAADAASTLGVDLPEDEVRFLTIHLATLDVAYHKEKP